MTHSKVRLDQFALDIEFLLISVIQGVALAALSTVAIGYFQSFQFTVWPYIVVAFIFILIFWSGAIIHALSFVVWPLDLVHTFLYFLASFIEVMAIYSIVNPLGWFVFLLLFQIVATMLYLYDLSLIRKHESDYRESRERRALYNHILNQQKMDLKYFIPASFVFNLISVSVLFFYPTLFVERGYHLILIILQGIFGCIFLSQSLKSYNIRTKLITDAINHGSRI